MLEVGPSQLGQLLLALLLLWVLRRLKSTGNGQGLPSLYRSVSLLSKDFGTLVEIIDGLFQDSSLSGTMPSAVPHKRQTSTHVDDNDLDTSGTEPSGSEEERDSDG